MEANQRKRMEAMKVMRGRYCPEMDEEEMGEFVEGGRAVASLIKLLPTTGVDYEDDEKRIQEGGLAVLASLCLHTRVHEELRKLDNDGTLMERLLLIAAKSGASPSIRAQAINVLKGCASD